MTQKALIGFFTFEGFFMGKFVDVNGVITGALAMALGLYLWDQVGPLLPKRTA